MHKPISRNKIAILWTLLLLIPAAFLSACGGDGGDDGVDSEPPANVVVTESWDMFVVTTIDKEPLTLNATARIDTQGQAHIFYYEEGDIYDGRVRYQIKHAVWDPVTATLVGDIGTLDVQAPNPSGTGDSGLNNDYLLDAALTSDGTPVVAYQGGDIPQANDGTICNNGAQGDLMLNLSQGGTWYEYLGIQGDASPKNPYFTDGYVGLAGSIAIDSRNNIHMAAQHYYEYCDQTSASSPDLLYVVRSLGNLGSYSVAMEEHVDDYNIFGAGGGILTDMGHHAKLVLDQNEQPLIFYVGTPSPSGVGGDQRSLRMAYKEGNTWVPEVIEDLIEWDAGFLSPAVAADGTVGVAYFMQNELDDDNAPDYLRYAMRQADGSWNHYIVDASSNCGDFCSLVFDNNNQPTIAYYDFSAITSYRPRLNLKLARFNGSSWQTENVSTSGDIGQYNTLWFDAENVAHICTYENNNQQIIIFREKTEASEG